MDKTNEKMLKEILNKINNVLNALDSEESKKAILSLYVKQQYEVFEVAEEDADDFANILEKEIQKLYKAIGLVKKEFERLPFDFEYDNEILESKTLEDFGAIAYILTFEATEMGAEVLFDLALDIQEAVELEIPIEELEILNSQRESLKKFIELCLALASEIEVLFEIDDEDEDI